MLTFFTIYVVGFAVSLLFLTAFGKSKLDINYDDQEDKWPDDWDTNAEAFVAWSIAWPVGFILLSIVGMWMGLTKSAQLLINVFSKEQ
jgi:hypothetical protein